MSRRSVSAIINDWKNEALKQKTKSIKPKQGLQSIHPSSSLEARLAVSPYVAILASPLRRCSFYSRIFPNKLLLRFGIGWHPKTKLYWAFPTFKKVKGLGYYVHLQKEVLESLQKGAYNATFRGVATYRTDMLQHVEQLLFKQPLSEMQQCPSNIYHTVRPTSSKSKWEVDDSQKQLAPMGYQCILSFNQTDIRPFCELDHQIGDQKNIPCYNMYKLCSTDAAAKLLSDVRILSNEPVAFALPKQPGTLNLAISLWRCRQFIS